MTAERVLIIEDDPTVAEVVRRYLEVDGYSVAWESDGARGLEVALREPFDLVVLDVMLPTLDGLEVCRQLRALAALPIVMLTARGDATERIVGLDLGADDYVAKPFSPSELVARVRAVLRRARAAPVGPAMTFERGDLSVDVAGRQVTKRGEPLLLTSREFELLVHLAQHPGRAFRRDELLEAVWGYRFGDASTVTVHVRRLREKIEDDPGNPTHIATVWGVGYRWES